VQLLGELRPRPAFVLRAISPVLNKLEAFLSHDLIMAIAALRL